MNAALQAAIQKFIQENQPKYIEGDKFIGCFKAKIEDGKVIVTQVEVMSDEST